MKTKHEVETYIEPQKVTSLDGIKSFNIPEEKKNHIIDTINTAVNNLLNQSEKSRYDILLQQPELYDLSQEDFLRKIGYFIDYIVNKNLFDPVSLIKVLDTLYLKLGNNVIDDDRLSSDIDNENIEQNIDDLKLIGSKLNSAIADLTDLEINDQYKSLSIHEKLKEFKKLKPFKSLTVQKLSENYLDMLDSVKGLNLFNQLELASYFDKLIHKMIEEENQKKQKN